MKRFYLSKLIILVTLLLGSGLGLNAQTTVFNYTGGQQTYVVPAGVTALRIDAIGGAGGYPYWQCSSTNGAREAYGGRVQCDLAVTGGMTLYIYVGGAGGSEPCSNCTAMAGGFNGGQPGGSCAGGSGGGTDIRFSAGSISGLLVNPYTATNRVVVAGAGGGGADYWGNGGDGGGLTGGTGYVHPTYGGNGGMGGTQTGPGPGVGAATGAPYLGTLGVGGQRYNYSGGGGGYWGGNSGTGTAGGAGGGSSYTDPVLCSNVIHTRGYTAATGNGKVTITVLCTDPGVIVGPTEVCMGSNITLTNATTAPGTWTSSDPSIATVSSTGVVTGVTAGTVTIIYSQSNPCGGSSAMTAITVNPPPAPIVGSSNACTGATTPLTNPTAGGTWSSSSPSLATVGSTTGVVTGVAIGVADISYTLTATGCSSVKSVTVNLLPSSISGPSGVCASGGTMTLSNASPGGAWTSSSPANATITGGGVVTGNVPGTTTITYTLPTGCVRTKTVTVNTLPGAISGLPITCVGTNATLTNSGGGTWTSSDVSIASVAPTTGIVTGVTAGSATITYSLASGCSATTSFLVNALPAPITGSTNVCAGSMTTLSSATTGGIWTSSDNILASVAGGIVTGLAAGTVTISYTIGSGCVTTTPIVVNALPSAYSVSGGGGYCTGTSGVHVGLGFSNSGVDYRLYNGSTLVGTLSGSNSGLDFGFQTATGTYTAVGIDAATGCTNNMTGSVNVSVNTLPGVYTVTGGGNYCPGGTGAHVNLSGSELSVNYQLFVGGIATGSATSGTGAAIDLGLQTATGAYTVVATNPATGCSSTMAGSATIGLNATPTVYNVSGGGGYCSGGSGVNISLDGSDLSVSYQLSLAGVPSGAAMMGSGSGLSFGLRTATGAYTIVATNPATGCSSNMNGSAIVSVSPLPNVYNITGGGSYCAGGTGAHVGLNFSSTGVNYRLMRNTTTLVTTVPGTNAGLDFGPQTVAGTYTVVAQDVATGCQRNMTGSVTVSISPLPVVYTVTGGGNYCAGNPGLHVYLSGSAPGILYQLYHNGSASGPAKAGTGSALDFGVFTAGGNYTVVATNPTTACTSNMTGTVTINVNGLPNVYTVSSAGSVSSYCAGTGGVEVLLSNSDFGIRYQLLRGASVVGAPIDGTGFPLTFGIQTAAGNYSVIATNATTGCTRTMTGGVAVVVNPVPPAFTVTGGGSYCDGSSVGVHVGLSGSSVGVDYQLFNGSGAVGLPVSGTGGAIDFGLHLTADIYTVLATNTLTTCTNNMTGTATISINPLPNVYSTSGSGSYCFGGSGITLELTGSDAGTNYQLMFGSVPSGPAIAGTGAAISFGPRTSGGNYTVRATKTSTGCSTDMSGTETITVNPLPTAFAVTGGGTYCSGAAGMSVDLANSIVGVTYQLFYMGMPDSIMAGTGSALAFGVRSGVGSYNVIATDDATGCTGNMSGSAIITMLPTPATQTVIGGGSYCTGSTGVHIGMAGSESGIDYQLYRGTTPVGALVSGTGSAIDFGVLTAAGSYNVVASPGGVCQTSMSGTPGIRVNPLPVVYTMTGGGNYCSAGGGMSVGLSGSEASVKYQLYLGSAPVGSPVTGTGSALDFGIQTGAGVYTARATDTITGCTSSVGTSASVSISTYGLPVAYDVTGGGNYCSGGTGVHVTLSASNTNINYQMYRGGVAVGTPKAGTGTIIDFGLQTIAGNYTVVGTDAGTSCFNNMTDTATVAIDPILTPVVSIVAKPGLNIVKGQRDTLTASATNAGTASYQWYVNGFIIAGATNSAFISNQFRDRDSLTCAVTSNGTCGGVTVMRSVVVRVGSNVGTQTISGINGNMIVIPNPNKGTFNVTGDLGTSSDEELTLEVTDLLGHSIYNNKVMAKGGSVSVNVQLGNVANGMYILSVRSEAGSKVFHVVVEQ